MTDTLTEDIFPDTVVPDAKSELLYDETIDGYRLRAWVVYDKFFDTYEYTIEDSLDILIKSWDSTTTSTLEDVEQELKFALAELRKVED